MSVPISWYLLLAAALFAIGAIGALTRRNGISIFLSIELMLNAVNLTLIAYSRQLAVQTGQIVVLFVMAVAGVVCTALAISGQFVTDLKTGYWLGSTPAAQQRVKFLGSYPLAGADGPRRRRAVTKAWRDADSWIAEMRSLIREGDDA